MVTFTASQRATAACALLALEQGEISRDCCNAVLHGCATAIAAGEPIVGERVNKFEAMRLLYADDPVRSRFLGGTRRAGLAEDMTAVLSGIDRELRAQLVAICELALRDAADRVAVKVARTAKVSLLEPVEKWSRENEPPIVFLSGLRAKVRNGLFAALTVDERDMVAAELASAAGLVESLLEDASPGVVAAVDGSDAMAGKHDEDRPNAVQLFLTAMTFRVLARLDRHSEGDATAVEDATFWDIASNVLAAAGGAAITDRGGLVTNADSRVLTSSGEVFQGTGFAQGDTSSVELVDAGVVANVYFRHSGGSNANPIHTAADGKRLDETQSRAGTTPGCRCWHETVYEEAS